MSGLTIDPEALADLGWNAVLDALVRRCATTRGRELAAALSFAERVEDARARIDEIGQARRLIAIDAALTFSGITDASAAARRAEKGAALTPEELVAVADAARGVSRLGRHLARHADEAPGLARRAAALADLGHVYEPIHDCFEPGPRLADHASDALAGLRRKVVALSAELEARAHKLLDDPALSPHLQDRFTTQREERYVVPIVASAQSSVRGIVHGTSQSGQTVFIEPEAIVDLNNRLVIAECEVADEERRILAELSGYVAEEATAILEGIAAAAELDAIHAGARLAEDLAASPPRLEAGAPLALRGARNPQMILSDRPCVPNDIVVEPRVLLLISGPNAGGKTVALKTAGLAVAMAHAGLHIAADASSSVPWLSAVYTHLGDAQSLDRDLSTFSAQVVDFDRFLRAGDEQGMVLFDEIAVGTDPEQGAALAQAVLEALADRGLCGVVTTHYDRLKTLPAGDARFANAAVGFDVASMQPTFRLALGLPGSSGAFAVARRLGLSEAVVARAEELLGGAGAGVEDLLAEIERERQEAAREREAAGLARQNMERDRERARAEAEKLVRERKRLEDGESAAAVAALRRAREEIDGARAEIRKAERREDVAAAERRVDRAARRIGPRRGGGAAPADDRSASDRESLEIGSEVYIPGLGGRGRVVGRPSKGKVTVQIGALRTQVAAAEVHREPREEGAVAGGNGSRERGPARSGGEGRRSAAGGPGEGAAAKARAPAPPRTPETTIDVRGRRVHEALAEVDRFLDQSLLAGREAVFVLHGHGTGALRRAVREHLASHPAVCAARAAEPADGGDGVTIARIDSA